MTVSTEFVNWLLIGGAAVLGLVMVLNHLLLLEARRRANADRNLQDRDIQSPPSNPPGPAA